MTNEELLVAMSNMMDQRLDEKLEPLKKDMSEVKDRVTNIENRVTNIEDRVTNMETQITNIKDRVTNIELNIENDIRPGIITLCDAYGTQFDLLPEERRAIGQ